MVLAGDMMSRKNTVWKLRGSFLVDAPVFTGPHGSAARMLARPNLEQRPSQPDHLRR